MSSINARLTVACVAVAMCVVAWAVPPQAEHDAAKIVELDVEDRDASADLARDSFATFAGNLFMDLDTWLGVLPVSSSDPGAVIDFNEIILDDCTDTRITFEIKLHGWDPDHVCGPYGLRSWEVDLDSSGYAFDIDGYMTPEMVPCSTTGDCLAAWGGVCTLTGGLCTANDQCPFWIWGEK